GAGGGQRGQEAGHAAGGTEDGGGFWGKPPQPRCLHHAEYWRSPNPRFVRCRGGACNVRERSLERASLRGAIVTKQSSCSCSFSGLFRFARNDEQKREDLRQ